METYDPKAIETKWILLCTGKPTGNCPSPLGPDFDFGNSPMLTTLANGRSLIVIGQKSGAGWAIDPDANLPLTYRVTVDGSPVELRPSGRIGVKLGILGLCMFLVIFLYPLRKRWAWLTKSDQSRRVCKRT